MTFETGTRTTDELRVLLDLEFGLDTIADDEHLLDDGYIDSLGIIELIVLLEESFDVTFGDGQVTRDNFASVRTIAALVDRHR